MEGKLKLAPPWNVYAGRVRALFAGDPDVEVVEGEGYTLGIFVNGDDKAEAIERLLPSEVEFGNVKLVIEVRPSNREATEEDMFRRAFAGNPALVDVAEGFGPAKDVSYALFAPDVVQLREDDISKYEGLTTLTYEELARSVLKGGEIRICSAPKE